MLGNNEPIEGVDLAEVFSSMLRELPWSNLRACIQANAQVLKRCTIGGHRLEPKGRKRFERVVLTEAVKQEFTPSLTSSVFAYWYPIHEELHSKLEDYFHSDTYTKYRKKEKLDEDAYVLPDSRFKEYFDPKDLPKWRILLCFSPLRMTESQAKKVLEGAGGNEVLIKQTEHLKEDLATASSENDRLKNENKELRARLEKLTAEAQELRGERKDLRKENDTLTARQETLQAEATRLRNELSQKSDAIKTHKHEASKAVAKESDRFERENTRLRKELETWQKNYEKQRVEARELGEALAEANRKLTNDKKILRQTQNEVKTARQFADSILAQIDWTEVAKQLKMTPLIKRKFNSLIKTLNYEEDRTLTLGGTLENFWEALQNEEKELVQAIAKSDVLEVQTGSIEDFWRELTDVFEDVHIGLEARTILLRVLQEIFYQTLEMKDLEKVKLPKA